MQTLVRSIFYFIALLLFGSQAQAKSLALCENLSSLACAPGSFNDGTGVVKGAADLEAEILKLQLKHRQEIQNEAAAALEDKNNASFRKHSLSSLGLTNAPDCLSTDAVRSIECKKRQIEGLTQLIEKQSLANLKLSHFAPEMRMGPLAEQQSLLKNSVFQKLVEQRKKSIEKDVINPNLEAKVRDKVFPQIRDLMIRKLESLPIDEAKKQIMKKKISTIRLTNSDCTSLGKGKIQGLLIPNAFYDPNPLSHSLTICSGFLFQQSSEFAIANAVAHEIAHSIDPCIVSQGSADLAIPYPEGKEEKEMREDFPIPNLLSCLRNPQSVGAKEDPNRLIPFENPKNQTAQEKFWAPKPLPVFCSPQEQIGESFADWMAAEITPNYIERNFKLTPEQYQTGYSNSLRFLCHADQMASETEKSKIDPHVAVQARIDRMILVQPKVRAQMNCPAQHSSNIYCDPLKKIGDGIKPMKPMGMPMGGFGGGMGMQPSVPPPKQTK